MIYNSRIQNHDAAEGQEKNQPVSMLVLSTVSKKLRD